MSHQNLEPVMEVEIDLFSGRANPVWELTPIEFSELMARLKSLPVQPSSAAPEDRLGYRGLHVRPFASRESTPGAAPADAITTVDVGGGVIRATRGTGSVLQLMDTDRSVECWLLSLARERVDESDRQAALESLAPFCP
jgi:hypothetical protein